MSEMLELGTLLREKREQDGLTLEQVSERIKLAPRTLAFIESGTKSELPHAVYVKGFVKSYATIVGLDPEELGVMVDAAYAEELAEEECSEPPMLAHKKKGSFVKYIVAVIVLAAIAGGGYFAMQSGTSLLDGEGAAVESPAQQPEAVAEPAPPAVEDPVQQEPAPVESEAVVEPVIEPAAEPAPVVEKTAPEPVAAEVTPEPKEVAVKKAEPVAAPPVVAPSDVVAQQQKEEAVVALEHALRIEATADCWVEATGEGFGRKEFLLRNGQSHTVKFPKKLSLRLGNSGGISLTLDGKPYAFDGKEGKVRTVHIPAS